MANRRTYADVIQPSINPNASSYHPQSVQTIGESQQQPPNRSPEELRNENEKLRMMIKEMEREKPRLEEQVVEEGGVPNEFNKRIQFNGEKIRDLNSKINEQEEVIKAYQQKFTEFEDNLVKIMKLDKDIHSKLVNPQHSSTLEKNVKNVMLALNSGAPYQKVIEMIDNIRV